MKNGQYTARQNLEIKGSFYFLIFYSFFSIFAMLFQLYAKVKFSAVIPPLFINTIIIILAYITYKRKKALKPIKIIPWIISFLAIAAPLAVKYLYAKQFNWTYAAKTYHVTGIFISALLMIHLFYNKKLYITFASIVFINWFIFLVIAVNHETINMSLYPIKDGLVFNGLILTQEIYFFVTMMFVSFLTYKNIPILEEYDRITNSQKKVITGKAAEQMKTAGIIITKMNDLFQQVNTQNEVVQDFTDKVQAQASTFEEISATMEELLGASENILKDSNAQVASSNEVDKKLKELQMLKDQTKSQLDSSLEEIDSLVQSTTVSSDKVTVIEKTIEDIKKQSMDIRETIQIIIEIADKINLLSLNASIEAARAGDHGRGFAVVADEIGKLANLTSNSIMDIEKVLSLNLKTTENGVLTIRDASVNIMEMINKINSSSDKIAKLKESILSEEEVISGISHKMAENIESAKKTEISMDEQKMAIGATNISLEHLNEMMSQMVNSINNLAETSDNISTNAQTLLKMAQSAIDVNETESGV